MSTSPREQLHFSEVVAVAPSGSRLAAATLLVPVVAWLGSLAGSYVMQDFSCSAAASAGRALPEGVLTGILIGFNALMLGLCVASAVTAAVSAARHHDRPRRGVTQFLTLLGILSGALFGYGVVLIGASPIVYGACS